MTTQEHAFSFDPQDAVASSLVQVTNQLSTESKPPVNVTVGRPKIKPQVVFINEQPKRTMRIVEVTIGKEGEQSVAQEIATDILQSRRSFELEANADEAEQTEPRFAIDPFIYEIDGPIPVMPTLPIVEVDSLTERVVAREASGDSYAWRLMVRALSGGRERRNVEAGDGAGRDWPS